jgi:hypothetical protein
VGHEPVGEAVEAVGGKEGFVVIAAKMRYVEAAAIGQFNGGVFVAFGAESEEFHIRKSGLVSKNTPVARAVGSVAVAMSSCNSVMSAAFSLTVNALPSLTLTASLNGTLTRAVRAGCECVYKSDDVTKLVWSTWLKVVAISTTYIEVSFSFVCFGRYPPAYAGAARKASADF